MNVSVFRMVGPLPVRCFCRSSTIIGNVVISRGLTTPVLLDNFHRAHNYLRISLTERCNLRCEPAQIYVSKLEFCSLKCRSILYARRRSRLNSIISIAVNQWSNKTGFPICITRSDKDTSHWWWTFSPQGYCWHCWYDELSNSGQLIWAPKSMQL